MIEQTAQQPRMKDIELLIRFESQKKSPVVGAVLNFLIPGAAYIYCDDAFIGVVLLAGGIALDGFFIVGAAAGGGMPLAFAFVWLFSVIMFAVGVRAVSGYNKTLADKLLGTDSANASPSEG